MTNFAYMSGTGNDFIVGKYEGEVSEIQIIALVSDAEYEVDGVIFVEPLDNNSVKMHYYNNDGSDAELCVNGVRCVAKFALDNNYLDVPRFIVKAPVGDLEVYVDDNIVEVSTPIPSYEDEKININDIEILANKYVFNASKNPKDKGPFPEYTLWYFEKELMKMEFKNPNDKKNIITIIRNDWSL